MNNAVFLMVVILVFAPCLAYSNPILIDPNPIQIIPSLFLIVLLEPAIIFLAVGWQRFRLVKFTLCWMLITFSTFLLLILIVSILSNITNGGLGAYVYAVGEAVVVIVEAFILQQIIKRKGLMKEPVAMSLLRAFIISFVINAATLGAGFLSVNSLLKR